MKLKSLVLMISLISALGANQAMAQFFLVEADIFLVKPKEEEAGESNSKDKIAPPKPDATMSSPVPPVSSTVNPQAPNGYPRQSAIPQPAVGMPPLIRAEIPGQTVVQSAIPQSPVGMPPPTIRSDITAPGHFVPPPRVEHQMQGGAPAVNVGPGPLNPGVGR